MTKYEVKVANAGRFLSTLLIFSSLLLVLFYSQKSKSLTLTIILFSIVFAGWIYFYLLYIRTRVERACITDFGIEIKQKKKSYLVEYNKIRSVGKIFNYGLDLNFRRACSYVVYFNRDFPVGDKIFLVFPSEPLMSEPEAITFIQQKLKEVKGLKND